MEIHGQIFFTLLSLIVTCHYACHVVRLDVEGLMPPPISQTLFYQTMGTEILFLLWVWG